MKLIFSVVLFCLSLNILADEKIPPYEQQRLMLINNTQVLPPTLPTHPVNWMYNREAVIPPQCYTQTNGRHNPCYVCHQNEIPNRENKMNDGDLQIAYSFSDQGMTNHWKNLFQDRSDAIAKISDKAILAWVNQDNYSELPERLQQAGFQGWIPDLAHLELGKKAFDVHGFAKDNSGWVAFNYKPFPSTFWPTNGSTDDVMIRLPVIYQQKKHSKDEEGEYSQDVYRANLAILEAKIKGFSSISSLPVDEKVLDKDLNQDGKLETISFITQVDNYVGAAENEFIDTHLYPKGTEFLHTVRYLGFNKKEEIVPSKRMKEVRYMRKWKAYPKTVYARRYEIEGFEKEAGNLPSYYMIGNHGLDNGTGWSVTGFIEDSQGRLRHNTHEENFFCMGCHNAVGSTIDKTFSFARKIDGVSGWGYIDLHRQQDVPTLGETQGEFLTYFERVGGGDEFRSNDEMLKKWFDKEGKVKKESVTAVDSLYELITPSKKRALALNKAYKLVVMEQSYIFGRDSMVKAPANVYQSIDNKTSPTLPASAFYNWDIRLAWKNNFQNSKKLK
jgi:hypothetical protein